MDDEVFNIRNIKEEFKHLTCKHIYDKYNVNKTTQEDDHSDLIDTKLCRAIVRQKLDDVILLLEQGASVNKSDGHRVAPIHLACAFTDVRIVRCLIEHGADVQECVPDFLSPLHVACYNSRIEMVEILIHAGAVFNQSGVSPLHLACIVGSEGVVEVLLRAGCPPNLSDETGATALHVACQMIESKIVNKLLSAGANCNATDMHTFSPLMYLLLQECSMENVCYFAQWHDKCDEQFIETMKTLLENGASIQPRRSVYTTEFLHFENNSSFSHGQLQHDEDSSISEEESDTTSECDDIECTDWNFFLYIVLENGHFSALQMLLKAGMRSPYENIEWQLDHVFDIDDFDVFGATIIFCNLCSDAGIKIPKEILQRYQKRYLTMRSNEDTDSPGYFRTLDLEYELLLENTRNPQSLKALSRISVRNQLCSSTLIGNIFPLINSLEIPAEIKDFLKLV